MLTTYLAARPRLTAAIGLAMGALVGFAIYGLAELLAHTWNPFAEGAA